MAFGGLTTCLTAVVIVFAAGIADAASPATLYAVPGGANFGTDCSASDPCSLGYALVGARYDASTLQEPVTVVLEPNPSSSGPQVFYGNWILSGASASDPITIDGNGQTLDGDHGTVTGSCETGLCNGPILTVSDGGTYVINDVTIQNADNTDTDGGGGLENSSGGSVQVTDSTFTNDRENEVDGVGGAIDNGSFEGSGSMTVSDSTFGDDSAADGGAIDNALLGSGTLSVADSTFTHDSATDGGAIDNGDDGNHGLLSVSDSTFTNDTATDGDAIDNADGPYSYGHAWTAGDVFAAGCTSNPTNGVWYDEGYNVGDSSCFGSPEGSGDVADSGSALDLAESLASNGGPTQTIALQAGSPAIGIIPADTSVTLGPATYVSTNDQTVKLCSGGATDQRGDPRAGPCDAGAYEYTAATTGTTTTTTTTTTLTPASETPFTGVTNLNPVIEPIQAVTIPLRTTVGHRCTVPKLAGLSLSKALTKLKSAGCRVGSLYEVSSVRSKGKVKTKLVRFKPTAAQERSDTVSKLSPKPRKLLSAGATLQLSISQLG